MELLAVKQVVRERRHLGGDLGRAPCDGRRPDPNVARERSGLHALVDLRGRTSSDRFTSRMRNILSPSVDIFFTPPSARKRRPGCFAIVVGDRAGGGGEPCRLGPHGDLTPVAANRKHKTGTNERSFYPATERVAIVRLQQSDVVSPAIWALRVKNRRLVQVYADGTTSSSRPPVFSMVGDVADLSVTGRGCQVVPTLTQRVRARKTCMISIVSDWPTLRVRA